ncbi:MAG: polysaccharide deacetylase family protein [Polaromonas sp.]|nr:polysaccharide deacetylase family protein [Polaromonas sp.]
MNSIPPRERDLRGYGFMPPDVIWPNGARLAVSVNVNYEEGAEFTIENGDAASERFGEVASVVPPGRRDLGMEELFAYGLRAGLPRFLDGLERHRTPATFLFCGRAVERTPEFARAIVERGHEPMVHGWRWAQHATFDNPELERVEIVRTRDLIESVTGVKPLGFMCRGSQSPWTRTLVNELGFLYDSNGWDDDLPYWDRQSGGKPMLVLPYALDTNDMKFYHPNGFTTAKEFLDYVLCALETLLDEAERGSTKLLNVGLHLRIAGRPARWWAVERLLAHLNTLGNRIWLARRSEIARHWIAHAPANAGISQELIHV